MGWWVFLLKEKMRVIKDCAALLAIMHIVRPLFAFIMGQRRAWVDRFDQWSVDVWWMKI
jgi:hypothetical protein